MFDFIEQHKKLVVGIASALILVMLGILVYVYSNQSPAPIVNVTDTGESNYSFLKSDLSEQDQYLMLLSKILTEDYGTYSKDDIYALLDLQNQSTESFSKKIQTKIDTIPAQKQVVTTVDPDSIKLTKVNDNNVIVEMNATVVENDVQTDVVSTVNLVKQGEFWLAQDLTFE